MNRAFITEAPVANDPIGLALAACHGPWESAWAALDERLDERLIAPLREGLQTHRAAVSAAGLADDPPEEWSERADRLLEYRRAVASGLLEPIAEALEEPGVARAIFGVFSEALARSSESASALPVEVSAVWPEGALQPHPSDGLGRRFGKVLARGVSAARKAGAERRLPLRSVAAQHLVRAVAELEDEAATAAMRAWAEWVGDLERAWISWAQVALPALVRAEAPDAERAPEPWSAVRAAATRLDEELATLVEASPHGEARTGAQRARAQARGVLEAELAVAGSFLHPDGHAANGRGAAARLPRIARLERSHEAWDRHVAARLRLYASILAILSGATAIQRRVIQRCREGALGRAGSLLEVSSRLRELRPILAGRPTGDEVRQRASALDAKVTEALQPVSDALLRPAELAATVSEASDSAVEALLAVIRQAPERLELHDADEESPSGRRTVEVRPLALQELARQAFDALRIERIRSSTQGLLSAIRGVRTDLEGLPEVFAFARDEALREVDSEEAEADERAIELLEGALERMAAALETRVQDLERALHQAQGRLASEITEGSAALLDRVGAGRMQAQLLAARSRAADLLASFTDRWGPPLRRLLARARSRWRRLSAASAELLRRGKGFVGQADTLEVASERAIQSLSQVQELVDRLPLVYQRLFTLEPISDPALLTGRDEQLAAAMARWRTWQTGEGVPLLIRGRERSGVTSFLRVLGSQIEAEGHSYAAVSLDWRIDTEAEFASLLSRTLEVGCVESLDDLAKAIFEADEHALPGAVSVDNLEHLYLRVPGGTDLAERFLTLMAETEPRVFWMGAITSSAWQLIATAEPTAVSQLDVMDLHQLGPQAVREAILARHRRSGLDVHYEESITAGARMRRRMRAVRSGKGLRKLLQDEFFEQLQRASGGYLGLALFLWLQSARFDPDEGVVMTLPSRPSFTALEQLSLTQNFTLKAFLEHRTLTLEEHDRIFRLPRHESYQIIESLRNRGLIEGIARERGRDDEQSEIEGDLRYRIRPLLTGAVIGHLLARNIVH